MFAYSLRDVWNKFLRDQSGSFGVIMVIMLIPILLIVGLAVDYSRAYSSKAHLQDLGDAAVLAVASSKNTNEGTMRETAARYIDANFDKRSSMQRATISSLTVTNGKIDLILESKVPTTFMRLASVDNVDINTKSSAKRADFGQIEISLVLDNTYSMSDKTPNGDVKLDALKNAAKAFTEKVMVGSGVKMGVVPFSDLVNVAPSLRSSPWLDIDADVNTPKVCKDVQTKVCKVRAPGVCYITVDKFQKVTDCPCLQEENGPIKNECQAASSKIWYGCVGMRPDSKATLRSEDQVLLNDEPSSTRYMGYSDLYQKCPNPILPLGSSKQVVESTIDRMVYEQVDPITKGTYQGDTFIPVGLTWGLNVLSPEEPYAGGKAYDKPGNRNPRKVMVLMTDGENTMIVPPTNDRFRPAKIADVNEPGFSKENWFTAVNLQTTKICEHIKKEKDIEIFAITFMVGDDLAKNMLAECSSDKKTHYFDIDDTAGLLGAFDNIADQLSTVRLVE